MLKRNSRGDTLEPRFDGPYEVMERKGPDVKLKMRRKDKWHHLSRCKLYLEGTTTLIPRHVTVGGGTGDGGYKENQIGSAGVTAVAVEGSTAPGSDMRNEKESVVTSEVRRYPTRERRPRQLFGEAIPWSEVRSGSSGNLRKKEGVPPN